MRILVICSLAMFTAGELCAGSLDAHVDSLYRQALAQVGKVPPEKCITAFEQALRVQWEFAPAHFEIAKQYMEMNTPVTRQSARNALNEAIRLDPENNDYRMALGELLSMQGFTFNADRQFRKLVEDDTRNAEAAYWAGFFAVQEYLALVDKKGIVFFDKYSNPQTFYWKTFAEQALGRAKKYLNQSIEAVPDFIGAYNMLARRCLRPPRRVVA